MVITQKSNNRAKLLNKRFIEQCRIVIAVLLSIICLAPLSQARSNSANLAATEPPALRIGEIPVYLGQQQSTTITITQNPDEFTLVTLNTEGADFSLELVNPSSAEPPIDYLFLSFRLFQRILLTSTDCTQCQLQVKTDYKHDTNHKFILSFETFSNEVHTNRFFAEQAIATNLIRDIYRTQSLDSKAVNSAIATLNLGQQRLDPLRACHLESLLLNNELAFSINLNVENLIARGIQANIKCSAIADSLNLVASSLLHQLYVAENCSLLSKKNDECASFERAVTDYYQKNLIESADSLQSNYLLGRYNYYLFNKNYRTSLKATETNQLVDHLIEAHDYFVQSGNISLAIYSLAAVTFVYIQQLKPKLALAYANKSLQLSKTSQLSSEVKNFEIYFVSYMQVVDLYLKLGRYYYYQAISINILKKLNSLPIKNHHLLNALNITKAEVYISLEQYSQAIQLLTEMLSNKKNNLSSRFRLVSLEMLIEIYLKRENSRKAKQYIHEYLRLTDKEIPDYQWQHQFYLAQLLLISHKPAKALSVIIRLKEVLPDRKNYFKLNQVLFVQIDALKQIKDYTTAYQTLNESLANFDARSNARLAAKVHTEMAILVKLMGEPETLFRQHTQTALEYIEELRNYQYSPKIKQEFLSIQRSLFELSIESSLAADQSKALLTAEAFKARTLYESIINDPSQLFSFNPDATLSQIIEKSLNAELDNQSQAISQTAPKHSLDLPSLLRYQNQLAHGAATLTFFTGNNASYVWLITKDGVSSQLLPNNDTIAKAVEPLLSLAGNRPAGGHTQWQALQRQQKAVSELLLGGFAEDLKSINHLTVVPDGSLHRLPFGLLTNPATHKPLLETASLKYANSIAADQWLNELNSTPAEHAKLLVIANPTAEQTSQEPEQSLPLVVERFGGRVGIPGADNEAKAVINLWQQRGEAQLIRGPQATKKAILAQPLANYQMLHFATHAEVDWNNPQLSAIQLASDTQLNTLFENPHLSIGEISQLDLNAELVVLSACDTASGKVISGEGPIGLSRAFFEAGAKRVLATLWPVDDQATALLQEKFYEGLLIDELPPAQALRQAQLFIQQKPAYRHPYFWAGFTFIGKSKQWLGNPQ